jgi:thioredoxin-like negative regulator of GroEL
MMRMIAGTAAALVALVGLGYLLTTGVGRPISTDLSVIGQGKPVLVLVYENYSPGSQDAFERLRRVMADYQPRMHFAVADLGVPQGRAFADRYQLASGQALFLRQDGTPLQATYIATDERELRSHLDFKLAAVE